VQYHKLKIETFKAAVQHIVLVWWVQQTNTDKTEQWGSCSSKTAIGFIPL